MRRDDCQENDQQLLGSAIVGRTYLVQMTVSSSIVSGSPHAALSGAERKWQAESIVTWSIGCDS